MAKHRKSKRKSRSRKALTLAELQKLAKENGISYSGLKKASLMAKLSKAKIDMSAPHKKSTRKRKSRRKSKSKSRRKSRRKSKSTRKGQVRKTARRAYMGKRKSRRKSRRKSKRKSKK
jgi:hypothetical protein